ncbi:MAG TPA: class I SAM-dependent methyltransferase [Candidatus Saccharimonadales bacterium]|nr:class I SAM-dependent methyltransferase [Candidatus Saccharimonadales bacterium]
MREDEYATLAKHERTYWWHVGRLQIINSYLNTYTSGDNQQSIINVGCGTGGTAVLLQRYGSVQNIETSDTAIAYMEHSGTGQVIKVTGSQLPFKSHTFSVVCAFDVLEHIANDSNAFKEWRRVLNNDGVIIVSVPAYQWLWSKHDVTLGHYRRYTKKSLTRVASLAGLEVQHISYAFTFTLPLVVGFRLLQRFLGISRGKKTSYVAVPAWLNQLLAAILHKEAWLHGKIALPAGSSIIAVLRKSS